MIEPNDDQGLAMLDEQQGATIGKKRKLRPELLLGLGLLALIGIWGGASYWHDQSGRNNYLAGKNAAASKDWDNAQRYFAAAGDYADAAVYASNAGVLIQKRDTAYQEAQTALSQQNWLHAYNALGRVRDIQPGYLDNDTLYTQAKAAVYSDALNNTVALRNNVRQPGLYMYTPTGWSQVAGTNRTSQVRSASGCDKAIVETTSYGAATTVGTPGAATNQYSPLLQAVGLENGQLRTTTLDPSISLSDQIECFQHGLLVMRDIQQGARNTDDWRAYVGPASYFYQSYDATQAQAVVLPADSVVVGSISERNQLIAVSVSGDKQDSGAMLNPVSHYVLINLADNSTIPLMDDDGFPVYLSYNASITLLLTQDYIALDPTTNLNRIRLIDPSGVKPPVNLISWEEDAAGSSLSYFANFLSGPTMKDNIFITAFRGQNSHVWIVDPKNPARPLWSADAPDQAYYSLIATPVNDSLLLAQNHRDCNALTNQAVIVDSSYQTKTLSLQIPDSHVLQAAFSAKDRLIYTTVSPCGYSSNYTVNSVPLTALGSGQGQATQLYAVKDQNISNVMSFGQTMFAYLKDGDLHICNYDGSDDTVVETGVELLYQGSSPFTSY